MGKDASWQKPKLPASSGAPTISSAQPLTPLQGLNLQLRGLEPHRVHDIARSGFSGTPSRVPHLERLQTAFPGHDLSHVQAYVGGPAADAAERLGANAYAVGERVAFRESPSVETVAHELTHVVQQREGVSLPNGIGSPGDRYEREAEAVGRGVAQPRKVQLSSQATEVGGELTSGVQFDDTDRHTHAGSSPRNRDSKAALERLLRRLPVGAPEQENLTKEVLEHFFLLRNSALSGAGVNMFPSASVLSAVDLVTDLKSQKYGEAALKLISLAGEAAEATSWLIEAGIEAGAIGGTGGLASVGVGAAFLAELLGPFAFAAAALLAAVNIGDQASQNMGRILYIADFAGTLTSWIFARPEVSPHREALVTARTFGYHQEDVSSFAIKAHQDAEQVWRTHLRRNPEIRQQIRDCSGDNYRVVWLGIAKLLDSRVRTSPPGMGESHSAMLIERREESFRRARIRRREQEDVRRYGTAEMVDGMLIQIPPSQ